jgi:hypothetical protein
LVIWVIKKGSADEAGPFDVFGIHLKCFPVLCKESACTAGVYEEYVVFRLVCAGSCAGDEACEGFAGVACVEYDAFQFHHHFDCFVAFFGVIGSMDSGSIGMFAGISLCSLFSLIEFFIFKSMIKSKKASE